MGHLGQTMTDVLKAEINAVVPDWTLRWEVHSTPTNYYYDDPGGNNIGPTVFYLEGKNTSQMGVLAAWDRLDEEVHQSLDTDTLCLFRYIEGPSIDDKFFLAARASGAGNTNSGYTFRDAQLGTLWEVSDWQIGVENILGTYDYGTLTLNTWYWVQFRVTGDSTVRLQARMWEYGTPNPAQWDIDVTDSVHVIPGWTGFGTSWNDDIEVDFFSVGTDGDPAQLPLNFPAGAINVISATPTRIHVSGTSHLVFVGEPNKALTWSITVGDGSLATASNQTDSLGSAFNTYFPGTLGDKTIEVTYGT